MIVYAMWLILLWHDSLCRTVIMSMANWDIMSRLIYYGTMSYSARALGYGSVPSKLRDYLCYLAL